MRILVTGFTPFGNDTINPTQLILGKLPTSSNGNEIISLLVPTAFSDSAKVVIEAINQYRPAGILLLGQAGGRDGLSLERVGINIDDARIPDNRGSQPIDRPIQTDGMNAYFSTLPNKLILHDLKQAGIKAFLSNSAGTFVCNHLLYQTLYYINKNQLAICAGFMHVPYLPVQNKKNLLPEMKLGEMIKGVLIALDTIGTGQTDLHTIEGQIH